MYKHSTQAHRPLPKLEELNETFDLNPASPSGLSWSINRGGRSGKRAGCAGKHGEWRVELAGVAILVHRVIWMMSTGSDPGEMLIDHIDRNPGNNDISNLRLATRSQNQRNSTGWGRTSRFCGVHASPSKGKWCAQINSNKKRMHLGTFRCETSAAVAYDRAAILHHGEFANLNLLNSTRISLSEI